MSRSFDFQFQLMSFIVPLFFIIIFGIIIFTILKGISQWNYNNNQPVLIVTAKVTGKRSNTSHHSNNFDNNVSTSSSTSYFATFEVESGDRIEFHVSSHEYGQLAEGDIGKLTFQGTRYQGFERNRF